MRNIIILVGILLLFACNRSSQLSLNHESSLSDTVRYIDSLIQVSRLQYRSDHFNDSIFDTHLQRAYNVADRNNLIKERAKIYQRVGRRYRNKSEFGMALYYYEKSLEIADIINSDSLKAHTHHEMAVVFRRVDDNAKALHLHFKALEWAEAVGDTLLILSSNNGIGNVHYSYKHYEDAIQYFHKSLKVLQMGHENKLSEAINTNNIGEAWLDLGNPDSSMIYMQRSYKINLELNSKIGQAICKNGMGDIYYYLEDYPKAIQFYKESIALNREVGNLIYVAGNLINLGKSYLAIKDYQSADRFLSEALTIAKKIGAKSNVVEALDILSDLYVMTNQHNKSIQRLNELIVYKDSITEEVSRLNSKGMSALYLMEKQEREILVLQQKDELSQLKLARQRILLISGVVTILGGLVLLVFIFYQRRQKTKYLEKIEGQHRSISDSIRYAEKIQSAILPNKELLVSNFQDHFILLRPRDVVSGDFYWFTKKQNTIILVTADCTGHGVPGALMSMLGIAYLNEIVNTENVSEPHQILNKLRDRVVMQLHQSGKLGESKDGMELSLISIDLETNNLRFSGAYNPIFIIRKGDLIQLKADKMPIGYHPKKNKTFTTQEFTLQKGDCIYSSSDGYHDQFGGNEGTKFLIKSFKKLLVEIHQHPMQEQKEALDRIIDEWRGDIEQIDDIIVLGIRI